jgi:hypothetical protein
MKMLLLFLDNVFSKLCDQRISNYQCL